MTIGSARRLSHVDRRDERNAGGGGCVSPYPSVKRTDMDAVSVLSASHHYEGLHVNVSSGVG